MGLVCTSYTRPNVSKVFFLQHLRDSWVLPPRSTWRCISNSPSKSPHLEIHCSFFIAEGIMKFRPNVTVAISFQSVYSRTRSQTHSLLLKCNLQCTIDLSNTSDFFILRWFTCWGARHSERQAFKNSKVSLGWHQHQTRWHQTNIY